MSQKLKIKNKGGRKEGGSSIVNKSGKRYDNVNDEDDEANIDLSN